MKDALLKSPAQLNMTQPTDATHIPLYPAHNDPDGTELQGGEHKDALEENSAPPKLLS